MTSETTNITELAYCIGTQHKQTTTKTTGVASRFWHQGDTYEQALARQQENFNRIQSKSKWKMEQT